LIESGNLLGLSKKAGELHGHPGNYLAYGVIAGFYGMKRLELTNNGMEVVSHIESNST